MLNYKKGPVIGEGTYGSVLLCEHKETGKQVAIKKVRMCSNHKDGINKSVLRELKALHTLRSSHIVDLLDVFTTKNNLVLVFEYMDWSLEDVVRDKNLQIPPAAVKAYMQMLLQALAFTHEQQVVHRDVKPDNLLIGNSGIMKLADFGLARSLTASPDSSCMTPQVFSRWYRPPELLMGCNWYGAAVDIWAAGCVLAELLLRKPWFPGHCDMDQLDRIFKALGVPTVESWPGLADLPHRIDFKPAPGLPFQQIFPSRKGMGWSEKLSATIAEEDWIGARLYGVGSEGEHLHHQQAHTSGARSAGVMGLDPADLAELAHWWRPRLDSAERRYLRTRKLQMDEALLQLHRLWNMMRGM
eukprot:gene7724-7923_t